MEKSVRVQFDISARRLEELDRLVALCDLSGRKDLFNNAFTLFSWAVKKTQEGNLIAAVNEDKNIYRELEMPALSAVKPESSHEGHAAYG